MIALTNTESDHEAERYCWYRAVRMILPGSPLAGAAMSQLRAQPCRSMRALTTKVGKISALDGYTRLVKLHNDGYAYIGGF